MELQYRLLFSASTWVSTFFVSYLHKEVAVFFLFQYSVHQSSAAIHYFITTQLTEIFFVYIDTSVFIANQFTFLAVVYVTALFLAPGLYKSEIVKLKGALKLVFTSWLGLILLFHKVFIPTSLEFFLTLSPDTGLIFFEARLLEYTSFFLKTYYILCISSAVLLFTFYYINLNGKESWRIKRLRKLFFFAIYFLAALVTPPDIFSQFLVACLLIFILETYTLGVIFRSLR